MSGRNNRYQVGGGDDGLDDEEAETVELDDSSSTNSPDSQPDTQSNEIPHRVRYDSPKKARKEVSFSLGDDDRERLGDLESLADREFDEKIYRTDVYLAALRGGYVDDDVFLEEMREIGYDYF